MVFLQIFDLDLLLPRSFWHELFCEFDLEVEYLFFDLIALCWFCDFV